MSSILGEETIDWENQDSNAQEEKIFVAIRVRPLNDKELAKNDASEWDCINNTTIIFKNTLQERSLLPTAYTFDQVFGCDVSTRQVYESTKKIALSALSGINSTIFAYGQTSSGKTYTMTGVTDYAVADIFDYINRVLRINLSLDLMKLSDILHKLQHIEREFVLKFSAIEIYNELVRDLLCSDGATLRLLDDPERGTVIDKLTEVTLKDYNHLKVLLSICEAQRQIGETNLNEVSSRSHQILRLTIESETRHYMGAENASSLTASVNFVDLAGSERASQTLSAGTRLKEGCHINRSLLSLGTVIRKLSKGRNAHIPYRDSKLTRILQNSLGGNARTTIICTLSPAHSHVEQSRNTLLFASCAKQVNTMAQVNVVMSEKALVKQLQKEIAKLENELRSYRSLSTVCASASTLKEKELLIDKMDKEIKDLIHQRDMAQFRMQDMIHLGEEYSRSNLWTDEYSLSETSDAFDPLHFDAASTVSSGTPHISERYQRTLSSRIEEPFPETNEEQFLSDNTSPTQYIDKYFGPDPCKDWEKITLDTTNNVEDECKEVQCIEETPTKRNNLPLLHTPTSSVVSEQSSFTPDDSPISIKRSKSCEAIFTTSIDHCEVKSGELHDASNEPLPTEVSIRKSMNELEENLVDLIKESIEKLDEAHLKKLIHLFELKAVNKIEDIMMNSPDSEEARRTEINEVIEPESVECNYVKMIPENEQAYEEEIISVTEISSLKELDEMIKRKSVELEELKPKDIGDITEGIIDATKSEDPTNVVNNWSIEFERQITEIIYLWDACHIPLIHRTYFFLLFRGDLSDSVYLEVELRRLTFLKKAVHGVVKDDTLNTYLNHSTKALSREREMLSRRLLRKFTLEERENLYRKWGISLKSKQRRLKLCHRLWSNPASMEHINESASIVAKLVGFKGTSEAPKEMFGLSFSPRPHSKLKHFIWRCSLPSIM